jgi:nucleotide-binding universal stress UspA family protein
MKILLAVDESPGSEDAVLEIADRRWPAGTSVRLLHVIGKFVPPAAELWYDAEGSIEEANAEVVERQEEVMEQLATLLHRRDLQIEKVMTHGKAGECIVAEAEEWGADLIVLGSHGHGALARLLFGSVSRFVSEHASCSVEVVHTKWAA